MLPTYESNCTSTLFSFFYNKKPVSVTSIYARLIVVYAQLDGCSPAVRHYPNQSLIVFGMLLVHAEKVQRLSSIGLWDFRKSLIQNEIFFIFFVIAKGLIGRAAVTY